MTAHPLRRWRYQHRRTLDSVAAPTGVSIPHLINIEKGRRLPSVAVIRRLRAETGLPAEAFLWQPQESGKCQDGE